MKSFGKEKVGVPTHLISLELLLIQYFGIQNLIYVQSIQFSLRTQLKLKDI